MPKQLREVEEEDSDEEEISQDTLYWSLVSAWLNFNEFSINNDFSLYESALSSILAYIANNGDKEEEEFKKVLGRLCYEHDDKLSIEDKKLLGLEKIQNLKEYGLELLELAAKTNGEVEDYLATKL